MSDKSKYYEVGETFKEGDVTLKVAEDNNCYPCPKCFYNFQCEVGVDDSPDCSIDNVHFEKQEK